MVGTHFPEERDLFESAVQRMREAFEGMRDGRLSPGTAEDMFLTGYDDLLDISSVLFLTRRRTGDPAESLSDSSPTR